MHEDDLVFSTSSIIWSIDLLAPGASIYVDVFVKLPMTHALENGDNICNSSTLSVPSVQWDVAEQVGYTNISDEACMMYTETCTYACQ